MGMNNDIDEKAETREEASALLNMLLESKKEGLAYVHAIVDGEDFDYKSLERTEINRRKYGIENSILGIANTLKNYIQECDRLSFGNKIQNGIRYYFVRPYVKEEFFYLLDETIEDIASAYKINLGNMHNLLLKVNGSKAASKETSRKENMRNILEEITEIECSNEFVSDLEESIDFAKRVQLATYKKI
jgi:hypothetical protein